MMIWYRITDGALRRVVNIEGKSLPLYISSLPYFTVGVGLIYLGNQRRMDDLGSRFTHPWVN